MEQKKRLNVVIQPLIAMPNLQIGHKKPGDKWAKKSKKWSKFQKKNCFGFFQKF